MREGAAEFACLISDFCVDAARVQRMHSCRVVSCRVKWCGVYPCLAATGALVVDMQFAVGFTVIFVVVLAENQFVFQGDYSAQGHVEIVGERR